MSVKNGPVASEPNEFTSAEIGALAHLYRGEVYRSTLWRTRLDTTTNWSVVTLGIAISVSFSSRDASPVPLILVGFLGLVLPVAGSTPLSLFQRLAGAREMDGNAFLRAHAGARRLSNRERLAEHARQRLSPTPLSHHLSARRWPAIAPQLHLDSHDPDHCIHRQDPRPSNPRR